MANKLSFYVLTCIALTCFGCDYKEVTEPTADSIIKVTAAPTSIPADGVSKTEISVQLPDDVMDTKRSVIFTTTRGLFEIENKNTTTVTALDLTVGTDVKKIAKATLIGTTDEGTSVVIIKVQSYVLTTNISFTRAYPETIQVGVDKLNYKVDGNAEITVTTQLKRNTGNGKISNGQSITLNAIDTLGNPIGIFRNKTLLADADGKVVNYFSLPASLNYTGGVRIYATAVKDANNAVLPDTARINVIK